MFNYVVYGLKKRKKENVITVGLGIVLVILLNLYFGSILSYQKQLAYLVGASIAYERMGKASVMYLLSAQQ